MKLLFTILVFISCRGAKEIQLEDMEAKLVKVDTVFRNNGYLEWRMLLFHWTGEDRIDYIQFKPFETPYVIGMKKVLTPRR